MSKGSVAVRIACPNEDCGAEVIVTVNWWDYPATWSYDGGSPPDAGYEVQGSEVRCQNCGRTLTDDEVAEQVDGQWQDGKLDLEDDRESDFDTIEERNLD